MASQAISTERLAKIRASLGDLDEFRTAMERFVNSSRVITDCYHRGAHLGKWVAAYRGKVVAVADTRKEVEESLKNNGVPFTETPIRFLYEKVPAMAPTCF